MFWTYILYSERIDRYYIGATENLERRLDNHNAGGTPSTKAKGPWVLKWSAAFETRSDALAEERRLKKKRSRKYLEWLIAQQ